MGFENLPLVSWEGMEKSMETTTMGHIRTTIGIHSLRKRAMNRESLSLMAVVSCSQPFLQA